MKVNGFVLCGGRSTRMGRDKALLMLDGETLVERGLRGLREVCVDVAIAGGRAELRRFGRVVPDGLAGRGPLGGIVAALGQSDAEWNAVLAVDVPFMPGVVWRGMIDRAEDSGVVAVVPVVGGREHPLCGLYARSGVGVLRGELEAGRGKVMDAVRKAGEVHLIEYVEEEWFRNLNTPEEFAAMRG